MSSVRPLPESQLSVLSLLWRWEDVGVGWVWREVPGWARLDDLQSPTRPCEEISGHKWETVKQWLLLASAQAEALTEVLVQELELDEVEVDAFWSFVRNAVQGLQRGQARHRGWTLGPAGAA